MARRKPAQLVELADQITRLLEDLKGETDRSAAIVGAQFLDDAMECLLRFVFAGREKAADALLSGDAPLSTFSAKLHLIYCLGLIEEDRYADAKRIKDIRNLFSHSHDRISFETPAIRDRCMQLTTVPNIPKYRAAGARQRFVVVTMGVITRLLLKHRLLLSQEADKYIRENLLPLIPMSERSGSKDKPKG